MTINLTPMTRKLIIQGLVLFKFFSNDSGTVFFIESVIHVSQSGLKGRGRGREGGNEREGREKDKWVRIQRKRKRGDRTDKTRQDNQNPNRTKQTNKDRLGIYSKTLQLANPNNCPIDRWIEQ
jgi:hypothetical protein